MDINRLTQKSQEALQSAQTKALRYGHQEVDGEQLLLALLEQAGGLFPRILERIGRPGRCPSKGDWTGGEPPSPSLGAWEKGG